MMQPDSSRIQPMIADGQREATKPGAWAHFDALLQAARRIDWRFLLPDPNLGQVAYIGPTRGTLLKSLRLLSPSTTVMDRGEQAGDGTSLGQYNVVVMSNPSSFTLRQAVELLRPGGWLYMEVHGPFSRPGLWKCAQRLRFVHDYATALQQLGMDEIEVHWHRPDFESCDTIIPLGNREALSQFFTQNQGSIKIRLKGTLGRWLLRSGLLALAVPCFSVVAHRRKGRDEER